MTEFPELILTILTLTILTKNWGKQHFHVMKAIRKMEPAWKKVHGRKFALMLRYQTGIQPMAGLK
jgi:hypothetical protein